MAHFPDTTSSHQPSQPSNQPSPSRWNTRGPGKPDPWIQRKLAIGIVFALTTWSFYVVVGRVCTPMIRRRSDSGFGRGVGIGTMLGYVVTWLLFHWTYVKMISTGPGLSRQLVPKTAPPPPRLTAPSRDFIPYNPNVTRIQTGLDPGPDPSEMAPITNLLPLPVHTTSSRPGSSSATLAPSHSVKAGALKGVRDWRDIQRPIPRIEPGPRWCAYCEINKPDRTHHCRHCGTCIAQFDHHCLWIGQCVGWANHKFFIIFTFWSVVFTGYMVGLLVAYTTRIPGVDGQVIGLLAVSAMFCLFTALMFGSHVHLILTGRSTVESYRGRDQYEREAAVLQREYGYLWHNQEKKKVKRRWREEWGNSSVDARWKWGNAIQMWEQEMGRDCLGWMVPIGRPLGDGIHFPSNPRFGPNGEWLKRDEWPAGVV